MLVPQDVEGDAAVGGRQDLIALEAEVHLQQVQEVRVVVCDEDALSIRH